MQAKKDATITASHMIANENINVTAENVTINGMTDHHKSHSETHETGFGVGSGKGFVSIYGSEGKTENEESFEHQGSSFNGKNITITATKEDVNVVGSDFNARENINVSAAHDVNVSPGHNSYSANSKEERTGFGIQFEKSKSGASIGVGIESNKDTGDQWEKTNTASNFHAGNDANFNAGNDANFQAANVSADRDVNIDAGNNVTFSEADDTSNAKETHEKTFAGVTASADIGVLGTVQGLKDSADRMNNKDGNGKFGNAILTGLKINHLFNKGKNFVDWLSGNTGERGNITKGLSSSLGGFGGSTKDVLANMAGASGSVSVGFKSEKAEASSQVSTATTTTIEGGRSVNINAHNGNIHGVGTDIIAGTNPLINDEQSGNINMIAEQNIIFESAQNTQSTQNNNESTSMSVGTGGAGATGSASFSQGEGSSDEVHHKNSHVIGTGTVHTNSGQNTTLAGAVFSGNRVEMGVGGDLTITSLSDTGQTTSKQNSVSVGFGGGATGGGGSMSASFQKDKTSSDYHSVVEQSGIKAEAGGFEITVKDKTTLTGGIIASTAPADKNKLTTGSITTSDITNSAHATASSHGFSLSGNDTIKNITKNVLNHGKAKDNAEGETKSAISDGTIILTDTTEQRSMGQDAGEIIGSLNRNTAAAHQAVAPIDATSLEAAVHNRLDMTNDLLDEGIKIVDHGFENMFYKEHHLATVEHDKDGNVIYAKDENGNPIRDSHGNPQPLYHYLTPEEEEHLQKGSDGKVHVFLNGIFTTPDEAAHNAVQLSDNKNGPHYFLVFPHSDSLLVEGFIAGYQYVLEGDLGGLTNSTKKFQHLLYSLGNTGLHIDGHSRGSMTAGNGSYNLAKHGVHGIAKETTINFFGPAFNTQDMADTLYILSDGKQDYVNLENHKYDFVGVKIGKNPYTFEKIPPGSGPWKERFQIFKGYPSVHACYGNASPICRQAYGSPNRTPIYSIYSGRKK
ncbi:hemagglutinin repeat-containing protein [Bartonella krasnovii]|nr:hemagglutinin repeat-containing protein [Bartonella krasnovii]UNF53051.1 hemagglutinin repeat-containing protein [Bartonella krasnovii]